MEFIKIKPDFSIEPIREIINSFKFPTEKVSMIENGFKSELKEAEDNRMIFVGKEHNLTLVMVQLILNNADNDPELANSTNIAHIHNLRVRMDFHRQGIARKTMTFVEQISKELGKTILTLGVDDFNTSAVLLYEILGYTVFKTEPGRNPNETLLLMRKYI
ncbi:MAG TPA: GNAT family N-acetyltransferase [Bacteriovoracaceae bacterium]|nr:GNAT family N-acetyltransferase [Bacteriovoracaceae bacterium]